MGASDGEIRAETERYPTFEARLFGKWRYERIERIPLPLPSPPRGYAKTAFDPANFTPTANVTARPRRSHSIRFVAFESLQQICHGVFAEWDSFQLVQNTGGKEKGGGELLTIAACAISRIENLTLSAAIQLAGNFLLLL